MLLYCFLTFQLPPSRPSFSSLIDQFSGLVCQNSFPNGNTVPVQDEIRELKLICDTLDLKIEQLNYLK